MMQYLQVDFLHLVYTPSLMESILTTITFEFIQLFYHLLNVEKSPRKSLVTWISWEQEKRV